MRLAMRQLAKSGAVSQVPATIASQVKKVHARGRSPRRQTCLLLPPAWSVVGPRRAVASGRRTPALSCRLPLLPCLPVCHRLWCLVPAGLACGVISVPHGHDPVKHHLALRAPGSAWRPGAGAPGPGRGRGRAAARGRGAGAARGLALPLGLARGLLVGRLQPRHRLGPQRRGLRTHHVLHTTVGGTLEVLEKGQALHEVKMVPIRCLRYQVMRTVLQEVLHKQQPCVDAAPPLG
mmetsp:Transcript_74639/g.211136  ORF Transcript_74639/g.211136 Transcript_74639/m.211136 type:complete len:235 (+) Transcript_74639:97-801(+)